MKPEPAAHHPFPVVKNMHRFHVLRIGAIFCLMLINSGCTFSYHVKPDPNGPDARSYALIEQQLKHKTDYFQDGRSLIRANESGFTYAESLDIYS
jgi:outer membrane biogenesis lipoprotein LolB